MVVVLILGLVGNNLIARQSAPDAAVRQFLTALQSGDASAAWSQIQVWPRTEAATAILTDKAALQAALAAAKPDIKSFGVTDAMSGEAGTVVVSFTYEASSGSKQRKVVVERSREKRFGLYPIWHLVIVPALLEITLPKGSDGVTIDGKTLALPAGKSTVAVLPLAHKVQFNGTQMLAAQILSVDASFSLGQSVAYQPRLTAAGADKARNATKVFFGKCAKQTSAAPDRQICPQGSIWPPDSVEGSFGRWQLVGDPTQDLVISFDKDLNVAGIGHYQMVFACCFGTLGTNHVASSGGYSAAIVLAINDLTVANIQAIEGAQTLSRPSGATDQAAKDIVGKALAKCATGRDEFVADCPQLAPAHPITSVRWTLIGDPLANATVAFDQKTGIFTVHGDFTMAVSYRQLGYPQSGTSSITEYSASLFWDGQHLVLVTVDSAMS